HAGGRHPRRSQFWGSVIQKVMELLPARIGRAVFLDALILEDDQCVFDNLPAEYVAAINALAAATSDNTMLIPWEIWRDNFIQDAPECPISRYGRCFSTKALSRSM